MIDINQWRTRIGLWYSCRLPSKHATGSKLMESLGVVGGENGIFMFVFLVLLLILSGDIELNPGPKTSKHYCLCLRACLNLKNYGLSLIIHLLSPLYGLINHTCGLSPSYLSVASPFT